MERVRLRYQATGMLVGYALQFLAGMLLNLFVTIPAAHPGTTGSNYFTRSWHGFVWGLIGKGGWELATHVGIAVLLVLGSISLFARAMAVHDKLWSVAGGIAALFTLGAFFNGLSFIDFNKNVSSMIMATCWLVAVISLIAGIMRTQPQAKAIRKQT